MASNFDFLKEIDSELFEIIEDAQKLFLSEYFNQSVVQVRIYAEKMAKKIIGSTNQEQTFDDILNYLKDRVKTQREEEFIEDLFFIKKQGNACAHGEDTTAINALEVLRRAFEAGINYSYYKNKDEKIDKLMFDETLLITGKKAKENKIVDKYLKLAQEQTKEELLNQKQADFLSGEKEDNENPEAKIKDKNSISNAKQYKTKNKNPKKEEIKKKIKEAKKNLKENINKTQKPKQNKKNPQKKQTKKISKTDFGFIKLVLFLIFCIFSLILIIKMIF